MSRSIHTRDHAGVPQITNLSEYIWLKQVRAATSLVNGQIIYNGRVWSKEEYEAAFPKPVLKYSSVQLDGKQIER